jgi:hypothetical protein
VQLKWETGVNLRKQLADCYAVNAAFDRRLAENWFPAEQEGSDPAPMTTS